MIISRTINGQTMCLHTRRLSCRSHSDMVDKYSVGVTIISRYIRALLFFYER